MEVIEHFVIFLAGVLFDNLRDAVEERVRAVGGIEVLGLQ